jgi:tetratricopeptide (TPR) repeat protein
MAIVRLTGWLGATACIAVFAFPASRAMAVTDIDRQAVYKEFRAQYDTRQYSAAKPLAEKLVQLTEEQYGPEELPLATPLTNLATVDYKLGNFPAAIENYQRSLRILQAKSTLADKAQIRPLHGLGVSFMGANDPESAVVALKRAADLSRNTDGLFNIGQVEFIDVLIDAYAATGRLAEAEKESMYAMRVEEAAYGRSSVKLMDRLDKLARWYESQRRYTTERSIYDRALAILARGAPENDLRRVPPLRGMARSFRLEQFYGVEGGDTGGTFNTNIGAPVAVEGTQQRRGESVLTTALAVIDGNSPVDQKLRGEVLADLGDWYLVTNALRRAYDTYAEAWKSLELVNGTDYLSVPRLLAYRPSISSIDRSQLDPAEAELKMVEMHFTVERDGKLENMTSPTTDVPDTVVKNSLTSMKRSRFAPRIENGAAVATQDYVFTERVLVKVTSPTPPTGQEAPPSGAGAEKAPEEKPPQEQGQEQAPEQKPEPEKK